MKKHILIAIIASITLLLTACSSSSNLSMQKYNQIRQGMTQQDVQRTIGEKGELIQKIETTTGQVTEMYKWKDGQKTIVVGFTNGRMTAKDQKGL